MQKKRKIYEKRSEILTKRLLSRIYALEADALESKMKAGKELDQISEQVSNYGDHLENLSKEKLSKEREKLSQLYREMVDASGSKWEEASAAFEAYADEIGREKLSFYERTQGWLNDLGTWISDLEDRTRQSSGQLRDQLSHQVDHLKKQQSDLWARIGEIPKTTGENWEKVTHSINQELNSMRSTVTKTYHQLISSGDKEKDTKEPKPEK
jgi:DNA anti-recombination protein RmuC